MTFTDEPSIARGDFAVRIEDVIVCAEEGGKESRRPSGGPRRDPLVKTSELLVVSARH